MSIRFSFRLRRPQFVYQSLLIGWTLRLETRLLIGRGVHDFTLAFNKSCFALEKAKKKPLCLM